MHETLLWLVWCSWNMALMSFHKIYWSDYVLFCFKQFCLLLCMKTWKFSISYWLLGMCKSWQSILTSECDGIQSLHKNSISHYDTWHLKNSKVHDCCQALYKNSKRWFRFQQLYKNLRYMMTFRHCVRIIRHVISFRYHIRISFYNSFNCHLRILVHTVAFAHCILSIWSHMMISRYQIEISNLMRFHLS